MRLCIPVIIISLFTCNLLESNYTAGDISIHHPVEELTGCKLSVEKIVLDLPGEQSYSWSPGENVVLPVVLEFGLNNLRVVHHLRFDGGDVFKVAEELKIFKRPENDQNFVITAGGPGMEKIQRSTFVITPRLNPSYHLLRISFTVRGINTEFSFEWHPGNPAEREVLLYNPPEEELWLEVTYHVINAVEGEVMTTETYPVPFGREEIVIDGGQFENFFLLNKNISDIKIYSPSVFFTSMEEQNPRYILPLPGDTISVEQTVLSSRGNVLAGINSSRGIIYKRLDNGTYASPEVISGWPPGDSLAFAGDVNGDSREDLLFLINTKTNGVSCLSSLIAPGTESGGFDFSGEPRTFYTREGAVDINGTVGRLDADDLLDIIFYLPVEASGDSPPVTKVYALYGPFDGEPLLLGTVDKDVVSIDTGDLDNDGDGDVILGTGTANPDPGEIVLLENSAAGFIHYGDFVDVALNYETRGIFSVQARTCDFNGDGRTDIFTHVYNGLAGDESFSGKIYLRREDGTYSSTLHISGVKIYWEPAHLFFYNLDLSPLF